MKIDVIKVAIPSAISEEGGAIVRLVNKTTVPLETSIKEAKAGMYVIADEQLIKDQFMGMFKSMIEGLSRDGHARQIGDFLTIFPVVKGEFDLDKGWDKSVNEVRVYARLLNELTLDITDWVFNDVTPGRAPFKLHSVSSGSEGSTVTIDTAVNINGSDLPAKADLKIEWALADGSKSGEVAAAKFTSDATRVDLAADALTGLAAADAGKEIVFTLRGNFAKATIKATLAAQPVTNPVTVTSTECGDAGDGKIILVKGEGVDTSAGKNAKVVLRLKGGDAEGPYQVVEVPLVTA